MTSQKKTDKTILRTIAGFAAVLAVAVGLIALGNRNDAASEGERLKAGLLTAHEVRMAFQTVGGRFVDRPIEEGVTVEAGQKLLALDPTDVMLEIESTEAKIRQQGHQIAYEEEGIALALARADETEASLWRQIEAAVANRRSAAAALKSAEADWTRTKGLRSSGAVSQAQYDAAEAAWRTAKEALTAQTHTLEQLTVGADKASREKLTKTGSAEGMALETVTNARREAEIRRVNVAAMRAARDELAAAL